MIKRIGFIVFATVILVAGCFAFNKLGYWERSVRIFKIKNQDQLFEGREGDRFDRHTNREFPDSIRANFGTERGERFSRNRNVPDSLRQQFRGNSDGRTDRGSIEGGIRNGDRHDRGDLRGGKKISLGNVFLFLAVFASFTVIVIYADKAISSFRKRKNSKQFI
jgi:hypothetical protein